MTAFPPAIPPRVSPYVFLRALGSQIAATDLLAPTPFASAEWGLKHAVPPFEGPAELSSARSLGCTLHPRDTGLAPQCWWPRPSPTLLTPWLSLGQPAQSWAPLPVEIITGSPERRRQYAEAHTTMPRALGSQFLLFHLRMLHLEPHQAFPIVPPKISAIFSTMAVASSSSVALCLRRFRFSPRQLSHVHHLEQVSWILNNHASCLSPPGAWDMFIARWP